MMWFVVLVIAFVTLLYFTGTKSHSYWTQRGIPFVKPVPFIGSLWPAMSKKQSFGEMLQDMYNSFPNLRYFGVYKFRSPAIFVRDPDLIKSILVKEFDIFTNRSQLASADVDPLWGRTLVALDDMEEWHDMRCTLSPSFTAKKMKIMFGLMKDCANQLSDHYLKSGDTVTVQLKDAFTRFGSDVTASIAFGVNCNSFKHPHNEFYVKGRDTTNFKGIKAFKLFLFTISPALMKLLKIKIFPDSIISFFDGIVKENLAIREKEKIVRPDMLHLLSEARKGRLKYEKDANENDVGFAVVEESERGRSTKRHKPPITDEDITAQALLFFLAGFETVTTAMVYTIYELLVNPDVMMKLQDEVDRVMEECDGDLTYEKVMEMKYLDMVVTECLRKWPPSVFTDRYAIKPYTIEPKEPGEKPFHLPAGISYWVPIYALHMDPEYYPEPEKFDPERFSDENKHNIKPFTYLPFGAGPRNCIGSRFALLEIKIITAQILSKFEIIATKETEIPMKLRKTYFSPLLENDLIIQLKPRTVS